MKINTSIKFSYPPIKRFHEQLKRDILNDCNSLRMTLENIHRVDGRVPKIPQAEGRVTGGGYHEPLGGVCTTVREFLVMPYNTTKDDKSARSPICRYS